MPAGSTDSFVITSSLELDFATPLRLLATDASKNAISCNVTGTSNQITVSGIGTSSILLSTPQDINTTSDVTFNSTILSNLSPNTFLMGDGTKKVVSQILAGTSNQVNINTVVGTTTLSLPQSIDTGASVTFGNITNSSLSINSIVASDASNKLVSRTLSGTSNQVNVNTVGSTTTLSLPQDINSGASVTFANITNSSLSVNSIVASDASNKLVSRTLSGTANQVNVNTAGTITTLSLPQSIDTAASVTFANITNSSLTASSIVASDASNKLVSRSTANQVNVNTSGTTTTLSLPQSINTGATPSFTGLNLSSLTASQILTSDPSKNIVTTGFTTSSWIQKIGDTYTGTLTYSGSGTGLDLTGGGTISLRKTGGFGAIQVRPSSANTEASASFWDDTVSTSIGTLVGRNISGTGFQLYTYNSGTYTGVSLQANNDGTIRIPTLTASKIVLTNASKDLVSSTLAESDIVTTSGTQTVSGNKTLSGTINMSTLTASQYLALDGSKNIITTTLPSSLLGTNNTWTGTNTFSNTVNISGLTASKLVLSDASKNIISSSYAESDLMLLSGTQTVTGSKNFSANVTINYSNSLLFGSNIGGGSLSINPYTSGTNVYDVTVTKPGSLRFRVDSATPSVTIGSGGQLSTTNNVFDDGKGSCTVTGRLTLATYMQVHTPFTSPSTISNGATNTMQYFTMVRLASITTADNAHFAVPRPGVYHVSWTIRFTGANPGGEVGTWCEVSSEPSYYYGLTNMAPGEAYTGSSACVFLPNAGDTFCIKVFNATGFTMTFDNSSFNLLTATYLSS